MDLASLISSGEGQTTEFKKSLNLKHEAMEALCSMLNADIAQGTVIFGIDPDGNVCGVEPEKLDEAQLSFSESIKNSFDPPIEAEINVEVLDGKQLILITAQRQKDIPCYELGGKVWIREGSENRLLALDEIDNLRRTRNRDLHDGPWICERCGNWARQLDSVSVTNGGTGTLYDCGCGGKFWPSR